MSLFAVTATAVRFHTYYGYFGGDEFVYEVRRVISFPTIVSRLKTSRKAKVSRNKATSVLERCR